MSNAAKDLFAAFILIFSMLFLLWMLRGAWNIVKRVEIRWLRRFRWPRKPDDRIAWIYLWQSGNVFVFNHSGQEIAELQGHHSEVREKILERLPEQVVFRWGERFEGKLITITRRQFEEWKPGRRPASPKATAGSSPRSEG